MTTITRRQLVDTGSSFAEVDVKVRLVPIPGSELKVGDVWWVRPDRRITVQRVFIAQIRYGSVYWDDPLLKAEGHCVDESWTVPMRAADVFYPSQWVVVERD